MVMLQDVPKVSQSWTLFCPHRLACGADELEASLKTWATTNEAGLEPLSKLLAFEHARWKKDWLKASSELAHDRRAWNAFVRDVVNLIGDAEKIFWHYRI